MFADILHFQSLTLVGTDNVIDFGEIPVPVC